MKNIFENAYFGKPYKTRDGRKAVYIGKSKIDKDAVLIAYEDSTSLCRVMKDGHYWATPNIEAGDDIVSEWQEEINEQELNMLAEEYASTQKSFEEAVIAEKAYETGYREGYRKAKEL